MIMHIDSSPSAGNIKTQPKYLGPLKEPRPAASDFTFTQDASLGQSIYRQRSERLRGMEKTCISICLFFANFPFSPKSSTAFALM